MTSIFTNADVEFEDFIESVEFHEPITKLQDHLKDLKAQGIHVLDVTLISTRRLEIGAYDAITYHRSESRYIEYQYLIKIVRPKYEVIEMSKINGAIASTMSNISYKSLGFFQTEEEAKTFASDYETLNRDDECIRTIDVIRRSPLDQSVF